MQEAWHKIICATSFKYTLIKIRSKISYIAFQKQMTISELFFKTCLISYKLFLAQGIHKNIYQDDQMRAFLQKLSTDSREFKTSVIMWQNIMNFGDERQKRLL
jgi:hypothetical protein